MKITMTALASTVLGSRTVKVNAAVDRIKSDGKYPGVVTDVTSTSVTIRFRDIGIETYSLATFDRMLREGRLKKGSASSDGIKGAIRKDRFRAKPAAADPKKAKTAAKETLRHRMLAELDNAYAGADNTVVPAVRKVRAEAAKSGYHEDFLASVPFLSGNEGQYKSVEPLYADPPSKVAYQRLRAKRSAKAETEALDLLLQPKALRIVLKGYKVAVLATFDDGRWTYKGPGMRKAVVLSDLPALRSVLDTVAPLNATVTDKAQARVSKTAAASRKETFNALRAQLKATKSWPAEINAINKENVERVAHWIKVAEDYFRETNESKHNRLLPHAYLKPVPDMADLYKKAELRTDAIRKAAEKYLEETKPVKGEPITSSAVARLKSILGEMDGLRTKAELSQDRIASAAREHQKVLRAKGYVGKFHELEKV